MSVFTLVVADDITGSNDIGIMYAKAGLDTVVYSLDKLAEDFVPEHEVTIIDTNSRFLTAEEAYKRVFSLCQRLGSEVALQFVNKQCSVFRGNIGAEFDAMLDAFGLENGMVVLGFPDNGRTTKDSIHYVHGTPLEESQFRHDPVHPMTESSLMAILSQQTKRKVAAITFEAYAMDEEGLKQKLASLKKEAAYIIFDVRDNQDLELLAKLLKDEKVICGSSAIGYYFAKAYATEHLAPRPQEEKKKADDLVLGISGSLTPQTLAQCEYMNDKGFSVITLDTTKLFDLAEKEQEKQRILSAYRQSYEKRRFTLIRSAQDPEILAETRRLAKAQGLNHTYAAQVVSDMLSELALILTKQYEIRKLITLGGDTSAAVCDRLGIVGMKILEEIEPGLPTCRSLEAPYYTLVLKSGSFGRPEFIENALDYV